MTTDNRTHFGFERVASSDKAQRVRAVFDSVAERYDLMNDLMSLGVHRLWKRFAVSQCGLRAGHRVLDVAGGTGDMTLKFLREVGETGFVVLSDINAQMLAGGRDRTIDAGYTTTAAFAQADAERLPFAKSTFDCVCIAFGLRNVTDKARALRSIYDTLKPGGRLVILEFSEVTIDKLKTLYDRYSFTVLPKLGQLIANDAASYRYLAESIRMHPNQETLLALMQEAGFERCDYQDLSAGIAAVHRGFKL